MKSVKSNKKPRDILQQLRTMGTNKGKSKPFKREWAPTKEEWIETKGEE